MKRDPALVPVVAALWLALGVFIIYPFIRLLAVTFTAEDGGLSLENLTMVFSNSYDRLALVNSIWLAIAVAVTGHGARLLLRLRRRAHQDARARCAGSSPR